MKKKILNISTLNFLFLLFFAIIFNLNSNISAQNPPRLLSKEQMEQPFSFANVVEKVRPSVVSVYTDQEVKRRNSNVPSDIFRFFDQLPGGENPFEQFRENQNDNDNTSIVKTQGSGFIVDERGYIVTNNHVIDDAVAVKIRDTNGKLYDAKIIGQDPKSDIAVLKVDFDYTPKIVKFADQESIRVGDWVVAIGNPFGLGGTVTAGIISAVGRDNQFGGTLANDYIQIDASINRGNSGGPTFDLYGNVVGINTVILSPSGANAGIGFAISSETAKRIVDELIENGKVTRGWLGVAIQSITEEIALALSIEADKGALVGNVLEGTPAAKAGLEAGDIIVKVNDIEVKSSQHLTSIIEKTKPGSYVNLSILRNEKNKLKNKKIRIKLAERSDDDDIQPMQNDTKEKEGKKDKVADKIGLSVMDLNEKTKNDLRISTDEKGVVVVNVRSGSPADNSGINRGEIILMVDGQKVSSEKEFTNAVLKAMDDKKEAILLHIITTDKNKGFRAITLN